jgi:hypothetical protein
MGRCQKSVSFPSTCCALNKKHPRRSGIGDYRPIVIISYVMKFLEQLIMPELQTNQKERLSRLQFGFVPNVSIEETKRLIYRLAKDSLQDHNIRNMNKCPKLVFFDLKAAYDSTDLSALYQKLDEKESSQEEPCRS